MPFRLLNKTLKFPELYPKVERKDPTVNDKGWDKVGGFMLRDKIDFMPQPNLQERVCACSSNLIFMCGAMSMGKAQPYNANVLTPNGFVKMGELKVGDVITGSDGKPQRVLKIFEQGIKPVYRVKFDDGASTECCKEHLWRVTHNSKHSMAHGEYKTLSFEQISKIIDNGLNVSIPLCDSIEFVTSNLPIAPYTLGCLLGDGCLGDRYAFISTGDEEILSRIKSEGYECTKAKGKYDYRLHGRDLLKNLRVMGLSTKHSWDKFIPDNYKYTSISNRISLLQGLIDTDGYVDKSGHIQYYSVSRTLALDVQWLIRSLGGRCSLSVKKTTYTYKGERKNGRDCYVLNLNFGDNTHVASLERKKIRLRNRYAYGPKALKRRMIGYEYAGDKPCRCILVSNPNHLYVTDDFIVTHNTYSMYLKQLYGIDKQSYAGVMISVRLQDSKKGSSIFRDAVEVLGNFAGCEYNSSDYPTFVWKQWNSSVRLIHSNFNADNPTEWEEFKDYAKKVQASYIAIDEATEIKQFKMFTYWFGRNRDASGMTPQMVLSFNPEHEHWTTQMMKDAGYIGDDWYIKPEMVGKTRYFYIQKDTTESIIWGDTAEEVAEKANIHLSEKDIEVGATIHSIVKSFTLFTGEAADNKKLVSATKGQSLGNLHAVGGTQRSIVKGAYFGPIDNEEVNVDRQMIHQLWENPLSDDETMYATMDISSGKAENDKCPMIIWRGLQMVAIEQFSGSPTELAGWIKQMLDRYGVSVTNFAFDATGHGYWVQAFTAGIPITWNKRTMQEYDDNGNAVAADEFFNLRSQLLGKTEVMLKSGLISCTIPKDKRIPYGHKNELRQFIDILFDELALFTALQKNKKTYYRSTDEFKAKYKFSPDIMTTIALRAVFELKTKERKQPTQQVAEDAYDDLFVPKPISAWGRRWN